MAQTAADHSDRPAPDPADDLILAAVARAALHGGSGDASTRAVLAHLAIASRTRAARELPARLRALELAGSLARTELRGRERWLLSARGSRQLELAVAGRGARALGESPRHRAWRDARAAGASELNGLRGLLREELLDALALLDSPQPPGSDDWLELGRCLRLDCRRLAGAVHCATEWSEPLDAEEALDELEEPSDDALGAPERARRRALRAGRRNPRLWRGQQR